jgi:osmotically-inducible protein OsmY
MNKHLLLLASASFFMFAPISQHQILGVEETSSSAIMQDKIKSDEELTHAIKKAILEDKELSKFVNVIHIKSDKGVVTLSGTLKDSKIKSDIEAKAKAVSGVNKVINNIEVQV